MSPKILKNYGLNSLSGPSMIMNRERTDNKNLCIQDSAMLIQETIFSSPTIN